MEQNWFVSQYETRYRCMAELISEVYWETDPLGVLTEISPGCTDVLGYCAEELKGRQLLDLILPEDQDRLHLLLSKGMRMNRQPGECTAICLTKDKRMVPVLVRTMKIHGEGGRIAGHRGIIRPTNGPIPLPDGEET